jgi:hypothetical protein
MSAETTPALPTSTTDATHCDLVPPNDPIAQKGHGTGDRGKGPPGGNSGTSFDAANVEVACAAPTRASLRLQKINNW